MRSKKLIEFLVRNDIMVKGHIRKTESGKTTMVKPHSREGNPAAIEEPKPKTTISPEVKDEVQKIVELATNRQGVLDIEHLRLLAQRMLVEFKKNNKPEQFIKEFKFASRKAEGKVAERNSL